MKSDKKKIQVHQWRNTESVAEGFQATKNKSKRFLIKFDVVDFHPSISEELLSKIIEYAVSLITIQAKGIKTIYPV